MSSIHEYESEVQSEASLEGEEFLGGIGNVLGGLLGEHEGETAELGELEGELGELEGELGELGEFEGELGELEGELGELGEFEGELSQLGEFEGELGEFESEQFFGKIARGIGRFVKKAAPVLKKIGRIAAPIVGNAIGGPLGGKIAGSLAGRFLREMEGELEGELGEFESEFEQELEVSSELESAHEMQAELMGAVAANSMNEFEAEAMAGAAVAATISGADQRALRNVLPHMVRGTAILTRILRQKRATRPAVRAVPTIVRRTKKSLRKIAARRPITRKIAGKVMAAQTRRVLGNPRTCAKAMLTNVKATRAARRNNARRPARG